mgnify:CR=1 FL=1
MAKPRYLLLPEDSQQLCYLTQMVEENQAEFLHYRQSCSVLQTLKARRRLGKSRKALLSFWTQGWQGVEAELQFAKFQVSQAEGKLSNLLVRTAITTLPRRPRTDREKRVNQLEVRRCRLLEHLFDLQEYLDLWKSYKTEIQHLVAQTLKIGNHRRFLILTVPLFPTFNPVRRLLFNCLATGGWCLKLISFLFQMARWTS